jgi:hypothetical protein
MSRKMNGRLAAAVVTVAATGTAFGLAGAPAQAATVPTIASVSPSKVGALTAGASTTITIKGKNFTTSTTAIAAVDISGVTAGCQDLLKVTDISTDAKFVIVDDATIKVNVPAAGCAATDGDAETVKLKDGAAGAVLASKTKAVSFIAPPALGASKAYLLASQYAAAKYTVLDAAGGQVVRVTASATVPFTKQVKANLDGKAMKVLRVATDGSYFDAVTPADSSLTPSMDVIDNGLTATFNSAANGLTVGNIKALPTVKSLSPVLLPALDPTVGATNSHALGYAGNGSKVSFTITGSGFSTVKGNDTVKVCGQAGPVVIDSATTTKIVAHFSNDNDTTGDYDLLLDAAGTNAPNANTLPTGGAGVGPCEVTVTVGGNTSLEGDASAVIFSKTTTPLK